jgi:hypothetical protein
MKKLFSQFPEVKQMTRLARLLAADRILHKLSRIKFERSRQRKLCPLGKWMIEIWRRKKVLAFC